MPETMLTIARRASPTSPPTLNSLLTKMIAAAPANVEAPATAATANVPNLKYVIRINTTIKIAAKVAINVLENDKPTCWPNENTSSAQALEVVV